MTFLKKNESRSLLCEQAIFTSVRTPMGEGYRIIAASKGLKPEEQQAITRRSPSHDALASTNDNAMGLSFYKLPTGRLCLAFSRYAGAEHTGRGGQRVYTQIVVLESADFEKFGYNAMQVFRALKAEGMTNPVLNPPRVLNKASLNPDASPWTGDCCRVLDSLPFSWQSHFLHQLISRQSIVVQTQSNPFAAIESLLLGLPGSMRTEVSFSAGLRFSVGRVFTVNFVNEKQQTLETRASGQPVLLFDPGSKDAPTTPPSQWLSFVGRLWENEEFSQLNKRTSRSYPQISYEKLNRFGELYNLLDNTPNIDLAQSLKQLTQTLGGPLSGFESELVTELRGATQSRLLTIIQNAAILDADPHWADLLEAWRNEPAGPILFTKIIDAWLAKTLTFAPLDAPRQALQAWQHIPQGADEQGFKDVIDGCLDRFAAWCATVQDPQQLGAAEALAQQWSAMRPGCPFVEKVIAALSAMAGAEKNPTDDKPTDEC